ADPRARAPGPAPRDTLRRDLGLLGLHPHGRRRARARARLRGATPRAWRELLRERAHGGTRGALGGVPGGRAPARVLSRGRAAQRPRRARLRLARRPRPRLGRSGAGRPAHALVARGRRAAGVTEHMAAPDTRPSLAVLGCRGIPARYGGFETFAEELATRLAA